MTMRKRNLFLFILVYVFLFNSQAIAHRPHDVIEDIVLAPDYKTGQTILIIVRGELFRSSEGGRSWTRIVKGLDNKYILSRLCICPADKNIVFLSTRNVLGNEADGIYKSEDGGLSWFKINNGLGATDIGLVAVSPHSSDIVLAAGRNGGLFKTDSGGKSWHQVAENSLKVTAIAFSGENRNKIIIGLENGALYYSQDAGESWKKGFEILDSGGISSIAVSPGNANKATLFVGTHKKGMFVSHDNGLTFIETNKGITDKDIMDIALSPDYRDDLTLFVSAWNEGVFCSGDAGASWQRMGKGLTKVSQADEMHQPHFNKLAVSDDSKQDKIIFVGGFDGLFKSGNSAKSWKEVETLSGRTVDGLAVSPDYAQDKTLIVVTYLGEIYISHDAGRSWQRSGKELEVVRLKKEGRWFKTDIQEPRFFDVSFSPGFRQDKTIFSSLIWDNVLKSDNGGKTWKAVPLKAPPGYLSRSISIIPSSAFAIDKTVYATTYQGLIYRSTDAGNNFLVFGNLPLSSLNFGLPFALSPDFKNDKTIYALGNSGIFKSLDAGHTWKLTTQNSEMNKIFDITKIGISPDYIAEIAISPDYADDEIVFAATTIGLFVTKNGGDRWEKVPENISGLPGSDIESVAVSPDYKNDRTMLVSVKGKGLFKSTDGANTFKPVGLGLISNNYSLSKFGMPTGSSPIVFSPAYAQDKTIFGFGSAQAEIFKSEDGGLNWKIIKLPPKGNFSLFRLVRIARLFLRISPLARVLLALAFSLLALAILSLRQFRKIFPVNIMVRCLVPGLVFIAVIFLISKLVK